jgi:hypothetical protein
MFNTTQTCENANCVDFQGNLSTWLVNDAVVIGCLYCLTKSKEN